MVIEIKSQDSSVGVYVDGQYVSNIFCNDDEINYNISEIEQLLKFLKIDCEIKAKY